MSAGSALNFGSSLAGVRPSTAAGAAQNRRERVANPCFSSFKEDVMDTLNRREEGFEREFSHQEEIRFRMRARRNRKLGIWAGEKLGLTGQALQDYAAKLVERGLEVADDARLAAELAEELKASDVSLHRVQRSMETFGAEAMAEIQAGR
jgi:hypothetical protein